jgi:hypothetical protein
MQIGCVCPWTGAGAGLRKGKGFNTSESQRLEKMRAPRRSGPHRGVERKGNGDGARYKKFDAEVAVQSSERKADLEPNVARPIAASTQTREILRLTENDGLTATPTAKPTPAATPTLLSNASANGEEPTGRRRYEFNGDFAHNKTGRGKLA